MWYKDTFRKIISNDLFFAQLFDKSSYDIDIEMNQNERFLGINFHELDIMLLLKDINPIKAGGPDDLHGMVLKLYCLTC